MIGHLIPAWILLPMVGVLGLFAGRLVNICVLRFPEDSGVGAGGDEGHSRFHRWRLEFLGSLQSSRRQLGMLLLPWSVCRKCSAPPSTLEKIPVAGWFASGRRCSKCNAKVSPAFTVIELITAAIFVALYWCEIPTGSTARLIDSSLAGQEGIRGPEMLTGMWSASVWLHLRYLLHMIMICGLIAATEIDRRLRIIPDGTTIPIMLFAVVASFACAQLFIVPIWFQDSSTVKILQPMMPEFLQPLFVPWDPGTFIQSWPHLHGLLVSLAGAVAGAGSVYVVRQIGFFVLKEEAMGDGDVVLMGMIGSVIGWQPVLAVFMFAPMLAIVFAIVSWIVTRDNMIPYGPFLSGAAVILLLSWPATWPLAKRFFDMGPVLLLLGVLMVLLMTVSLQFVQVIKRIFGIGPREEPGYGDGGWSSADHLSYYNGERPDEQTCDWSKDQWPGSRAGRGLKPYNDWLNGN